MMDELACTLGFQKKRLKMILLSWSRELSESCQIVQQLRLQRGENIPVLVNLGEVNLEIEEEVAGVGVNQDTGQGLDQEEGDLDQDITARDQGVRAEGERKEGATVGVEEGAVGRGPSLLDGRTGVITRRPRPSYTRVTSRT